jgi:ABC-type transporter Mla subunit MlaD
LYDAMVDVGSGIPENMAPEDLPQWAEEWIELTEAAAREAAGIAPDDIDDQLNAAEDALGRHARAMGRIDQMEAAAEQTARKAQQLEMQISRAEQPTRAGASEALDNLLPQLERINASAGSSVPVVLSGQFGQLTDDEVEDLLFSLEAFTQHFQLIVVTERERAQSWASGVGLERASSV